MRNVARPRLLAPVLAVNVLIASGTFLVARATLATFPPLVLALFRFVLATAVLLPIVRMTRRDVRIAPADRPRLLLLGVLAVPLNQGLFLLGLRWSSASHAALLYALTPAFVALIDRARGTPLGRRALAGIVLAFTGVASLLVQRGLHFDRHSVAGDGITLLAVMAWSGYLALGRDVVRRYGPLVVTAEALWLGTLVYLPIGLLALRGFDPAQVSPAAWAGLGYLAWLTSGLNYVIWFWGLAHLNAAAIATLTNLQPVVAAALAWLLLHERLPAGFALSTALVLAGVWLAQSAGRGRTGAPAPAPAGGPASG